MFVRYERVLLTLDGSALSERAIEHAVAVAHANDAALTVLRVADPEAPAVLEPLPPDLQLSLQLAAVERYLEELVRPLRERWPNTRSAAVFGEAATTILAEAATRDAQLIVMATHGRSGFKRWVLGSVAEKVLRDAPVPVLLVRAAEGASHDA
jgi:nucleotide-binding universal stress UspA family protein